MSGQESNHGGLTREQIYEQLMAADDNYTKWGFEDDGPKGAELYEALFAQDPIEWNRIGAFQDVTMRMIAAEALYQEDTETSKRESSIRRKSWSPVSEDSRLSVRLSKLSPLSENSRLSTRLSELSAKRRSSRKRNKRISLTHENMMLENELAYAELGRSNPHSQIVPRSAFHTFGARTEQANKACDSASARSHGQRLPLLLQQAQPRGGGAHGRAIRGDEHHGEDYFRPRPAPSVWPLLVLPHRSDMDERRSQR